VRGPRRPHFVTRRASLALPVLAVVGCADRRDVSGQTPRAGRALEFSVLDTRGVLVTAESLRGRATAVLFFTTFDPASQIAARRLDALLRRHKPRANGLAVSVEPPRYAPLVEVFAQTLEPVFPVAIADESIRSGSSDFGDVGVVPVLVVLDHRGAPVAHWIGLAPDDEIDAALSRGAR
jgi:hypothetical protein